MPSQPVLVLVVGAATLLMIALPLGLVFKFYRRVPQGRALIVNKMGGEPHVTFTGMLVLPGLHTAEEIDVSIKTISVEATGREALISKDGARVELRMLFYFRVNNVAEDVIKVARSLGCAGANDPKRIEELFVPKCLEAMKLGVSMMDAETVSKSTMELKDGIIEVIGADLNGFHLDDAVVERLEVRAK